MQVKLYNYRFRQGDKQIFTNASTFGADLDDLLSCRGEMLRTFSNNLSAYGFVFVTEAQAQEIETRTDGVTFCVILNSNTVSTFNKVVDVENKRIYDVIDMIARPNGKGEIICSCACQIDAWHTLQFMGMFDYGGIAQYNEITPARMHKNRLEIDANGAYVRPVYNADAEQPVIPQKRLIKSQVNYQNISDVRRGSDNKVLGGKLIPFLVLSIERPEGYIVKSKSYQLYNVYDIDGNKIFDVPFEFNKADINTKCKGSPIEQIFIPLYDANDTSLEYISAIINGADVYGFQYQGNGVLSANDRALQKVAGYIKSVQDVSIIYFEIGDLSQYTKAVFNTDLNGIKEVGTQNVTDANTLSFAISQHYKLPLYLVSPVSDVNAPDVAYGFGSDFADLFYNTVVYYPNINQMPQQKIKLKQGEAFTNDTFDSLIDVESKVHTMPYKMFTLTDNNGIDANVDVATLDAGDGIILKRHALPNSFKSSINIRGNDTYLQGDIELYNKYKVTKQSVPYIQSQLFEFLNNEKNALIQGAGNKIVGGMLSAGVNGVLSGNLAGGLVRGVGAGIDTAINTAVSIENQMLFLQDADGRYVNTGNDALYNLLYQSPDLILYEVAQCDDILNDLAYYYHAYGYVNNKRTTLFNIIVNGRDTFNYVETQENMILMPRGVITGEYNLISSLITKCNEELKGGVYFWCNQQQNLERPQLESIVNKEKSNLFITRYNTWETV